MMEQPTPVPHELTQRVIGGAYAVSNELGCGFLEKVYENALVLELRAAGLAVEQQKPITVYYRESVVGEFFADMVVEGVLLVEIKAVKKLDEVHCAQCLNYLQSTGRALALLINFGPPRVEVRRVINSAATSDQ